MFSSPLVNQNYTPNLGEMLSERVRLVCNWERPYQITHFFLERIYQFVSLLLLHSLSNRNRSVPAECRPDLPWFHRDGPGTLLRLDSWEHRLVQVPIKGRRALSTLSVPVPYRTSVNINRRSTKYQYLVHAVTATLRNRLIPIWYWVPIIVNFKNLRTFVFYDIT